MATEGDERRAAAAPNERRWDRGAWLTLAAAVLIVFWPIATGFASFRYPGDGWVSYASGGFGSEGGSFVMEQKLIAGESPLRVGDVVTALDGRPFATDQLPPVPADRREGQILTYTIERDGRTLDIEVPLVRLTPRAFLAGIATSWVNVLIPLLFVSVSLFAFLARPGSHGARYLLLAFVFSLAASLDNASYSFYRFAYPPPLVLFAEQISLGWTWLLLPSLGLMMLVYPVRKKPMRRFPLLLPAVVYGTFFLLTATAILLVLVTRDPTAGRDLNMFANGLSVIFCAFTILVCLVHNFLTVRDPVARAQLRWLALGLGLGMAIPLLGVMPFLFVFPDSPLRDPIVNVMSYAILLAPICLAIGIVRYRLFDIDVIIRRTTSYAIITALLALVYLGSVVVLQRLFGELTGENSTAAVVFSTLLIAALFLPVRRRVQDAIDRRFNRTRYNAEKTLERFAATARDETDLDALLAELVAVIQQTMEPESVSVWLKPTADGRPLTAAERRATSDQ